MKEQFKLLHGTEAPYSHIKGKLPIMGCFATRGLEIKAYFISNHNAYGSIGDHRIHVIDFSSQSIIGDNLPRVTKRSGRKLQWKVPPTSRKYTRDLVRVSRANKLDKKAIRLRNPDNFATSEEYRIARESFDRVHCQLQLHCESRCRKYKLDKLEWSPRITEIGLRLRIYKWIVGFKRGKKCNIQNLERACWNNLMKTKSDPKSR